MTTKTRSRPRRRARWTLTRWADDYAHLDYTNPHTGTGRHRANDD